MEERSKKIQIKDAVESSLVGDIRGLDVKTADKFLVELEALMSKYEIDKLDVAWKHFSKPSEDKNIE